MMSRYGIRKRKETGWQSTAWAAMCLFGVAMMVSVRKEHWVAYVFIAVFLVLGLVMAYFAVDSFWPARTWGRKLGNILKKH